eukprot:m.183928 g.183928  ORF g.183928 m.183928 type:complete len:75 (-) comp16900_c0_seq3:94-318(-)
MLLSPSPTDCQDEAGYCVTHVRFDGDSILKYRLPVDAASPRQVETPMAISASYDTVKGSYIDDSILKAINNGSN